MIVGRAANPTLENFDQRHFRTNAAAPGIIQTRLSSSNFSQSGDTWTITNVSGATGASLWTNDLSVGSPSKIRIIDGISDFYTELTNTFTRGWSADEFIFPVLSLGNNTLDSDLYSAFLLLSPTNDPAQVIIRLKAPLTANNLELMCYTNDAFTGQCRLEAGSTVSGSGGTVRLNNNQDWDGINGAVIRLRYISPDWIEVGRWFAGSNSQPQAITINPTLLYAPVKIGASEFGDLPLHVPSIGSTNMIVDGQLLWGGLTNSLFRSANNLVYTNGGNTVQFEVRKGDGASAKLGLSTGSHVLLLGGTGSDVYVGVNNNGSGDYVFTGGGLSSTSDAADDLGGPLNRWKDIYLSGTINGGTISGAANWTASGTTNSTLPGVASANLLVATNAVWAYGSGTNGTFVGHPTDSAVFWGSNFSGLSFIDVISSATGSSTEGYLGVYSSGAPTTRSYLQLYSSVGNSEFHTRRQVTGTTTGLLSLGVDSSSPYLIFGGSSSDVFLRRDAANTLAMRNGTAAQTLNIYNSFTDSSNYERLAFPWSGNVAFIQTSQAGSGTARALTIRTTGGAAVNFGTSGTLRWNVSSSGHFLAEADNTYDIGASGATRPRDIFVADDIVAGDDITATGDITGAFLNGDVIAPTFIQTADRFQWLSSSRLNAPSDGVIHISNAAENDFNRLQFGGLTASYPALKRSSTELQVRLADDSADAPLKSGQLSNTGIRVMTPSSLQTLAAGNALLANATKVRVVGSGGAVTLTSTPTIADGSDGQYVMIQGTDNTNTLTVQDQGSLASSNLELGAATRVLGAGDVLVLTFDSTASVWYEVSFANN